MTINIREIVQKLVGPIDPVGAEHVDKERYENLQAMIDLVDTLVMDIDCVSCMRDSHMASVKKAGDRAKKFLDDLGIVE